MNYIPLELFNYDANLALLTIEASSIPKEYQSSICSETNYQIVVKSKKTGNEVKFVNYKTHRNPENEICFWELIAVEGSLRAKNGKIFRIKIYNT